MSSISLMTSPIIDLTSRPESPKEHSQLKATTTDTTTTTTTLPPPQAPKQSTTEAMMVKRIEKLEHTLADLIQVNKTMEERLDKHEARLYTLEQLDIPQQVSIAETNSYKSHEVHMQLFEALERSINHDQSEELAHDLAEARKKKKKSRESPKTPPGLPSHQPPPPPPPAGPSGTSGAPRTSGAQVTPPPPPPPTSTNQDIPSTGSAAPSPAKTSAHIPTVNLRQGWWKPFEEERPATPEPAWSIRSSDVPIPSNNWASTLAYNYSSPPEDSLLAQTGDITSFMDWFCKRRGITELKPQDLEGPAYEIVKRGRPYTTSQRQQTTTTGGSPGHVTIQSDFFFNKDLEYLRYGNKGRRPALSISKMKAAYYLDAGLEQMVPDQFWIRGVQIRYCCNRVEDFQLGIESYQTQVNLTKPQWTATGFEYKHDYTVIESPRAVIFRDKYEVQMMMRFNEIHKFNEGTLQQIVEALDYRVKEFRINRMNPGLNTRWQSAPASDHSKSKRTIESSVKRSSKISSLGHDSTLLASSYTVKSKAYIKSPTHYPCGVARTSE
nr:hypothetical protein [Tanacetum cinerariifolium]